ncbi:Hint domain-containing protein [Candidatus Rhodoblastus alkanivorans]|uniref:Hint domain-containing protein n=1 Tax=Candidatus Rhodoblastus alkanivorans TaxID=2954117 RepID=UPI003CC8810D
MNWLGKQTVSPAFADPIRGLSIRVKAGALGETTPSRDLLLSHERALLIDGVLNNAGALGNGTSIGRDVNLPRAFVHYHTEIDDHSLIFAENAPAETFIDNIDRKGTSGFAFGNPQDIVEQASDGHRADAAGNRRY